MKLQCKRRVVVALLSVTSLVGASAGAVAYANSYASRVVPSTTVSGVDISGLNAKALTAKLERAAAETKFVITTDGKTSTYTASQLGLSLNTKELVKQAMAPSHDMTKRYSALFDEHSLQAKFSLKTSAVTEVATKLNAQLKNPAKDAQVVLAGDGESLSATAAQTGERVDSAALAKLVHEKVALGKTVSITAPVTTHKPDISTAEATAAAAGAANMLTPSVSLTDGIDNFSATNADKASWLSFKRTSSGVSVVYDQDKIKAWVTKVAKGTETKAAAPSLRTVDAKGNQVAVTSVGDVAYTASNIGQVTSEMVTALNAGEDYSGSFDYAEGYVWQDRHQPEGKEVTAYQPASNEKWVDVDLTNHTVTAYVGTKIVWGPVGMVSGAPYTPTIEGTFKVHLKYEYQTMEGANSDGSKYETPDVPWVTYFEGGYALHGAYWRDRFGYDAGYNGSHGCVNMKVEDAKWIYDWAPEGTTVVSHY